MRTSGEILFRVRQEVGNLRRFVWPGTRARAPLVTLPEPIQVDGMVALAEQVLTHRFPLLGFEVATGERIEWRRDYVNGKTSGTAYFRRVPYLDFSRAGDHKIVWELNRHQHLVLLAQAFRLTGRQEFAGEIVRQIESWWDDNPWMRGINWVSALEVAFRALSWLWVIQIAGPALPEMFRKRLIEEIWRHGLYLENNLSVYFSPNTHLLGEAVALHALGMVLGEERWRAKGRALALDQMRLQVRADGSHFEQSSYYHVYALDMFLFHHTLEPGPPEFVAALERMADFLDALIGPGRRLPFLGDDDGGRFFHPYGRRDEFARATLEAFGQRPRRSKLFPDSGLAVMISGEKQVIVDAGSMGFGGAGHSHADALSVMARIGDEEILIDPGTFTYVSEPQWREWFRSTAAHNTVRIDGRDQATPAGPFRWASKPEVAVRQWTTTEECDHLDAECRYGLTHRRRIWFRKPDLLFVLDEIEGAPGEHLVEQFWHLADARHHRRLSFSEPAQTDCAGWRSPVYGVRVPAPVVCVTRRGPLPMRLAAVLDLSDNPKPAPPRLVHRDGRLTLVCGDVRLPA